MFNQTADAAAPKGILVGAATITIMSETTSKHPRLRHFYATFPMPVSSRCSNT